jgi:hypothetical protein
LARDSGRCQLVIEHKRSSRPCCRLRAGERREFKDQDPVNIEASELVGKLHDALEATNYKGHDLERFLVRIVFCLFADDTGIFDPRNLLLDYLKNRTNEDGSDTGSKLIELFSVLDTPERERQTNLDEDLAAFPYINGDLFTERLRPPSFDSKMRTLLIEACEFRWDAISPAIFGALFQSVMDAKERRRKGAHYTTELNILKLIKPLFLDALHAELADIKTRRGTDRRNKLTAFHDKIAGLTFFDPACGCGNFLIITYRELRRIEIEVLKELHSETFNRPGFTRSDFKFDVASLSKLDVDKFYGIEIEEFSARIAETAMWMMDHIMNNELSLAFGEPYARIPLKKSATIKHADALEEDWVTFLAPEHCSYVFGNPPFSGAKYQSDVQRAQVCDTPKAIIGSKPIDGGYLIFDDEEKLALLAGEPKAAEFLRPFIGSVDYIQGGGRWILALQKAPPEQIRSLPKVVERLQKVREYRTGKIPAKSKTAEEAKLPGMSARALADTPTKFHVTVIPESSFLVVPEVSSERRDYVPIGWLGPPTIPSNLVRIIPTADIWLFAVLTSRVHMAWLRNIGGRLKSDYRYSIGIVYNTFPWPEASEAQKQKLRELAQAVLDARGHHPNATLADLYDPDTMPPDLRKAHSNLDSAADALYKRGGFQSDRERVEHLFALYEKLVQPLTAVSGKKRAAKRRPATSAAKPES